MLDIAHQGGENEAPSDTMYAFPENETTYNQIIDTCADGLMSSSPTVLERILDERHIRRPGTGR